MIYAYPCDLTPDQDGGLEAIFPDVPEAITGGENRSQVLERAEAALTTALAGYAHEKWKIPAPRPPVEGQELVAVPTVVAAKLALYSVMRQLRGTKGQSVIPAKAGIQGWWRGATRCFPAPRLLDSRFRGNDDFGGQRHN